MLRLRSLRLVILFHSMVQYLFHSMVQYLFHSMVQYDTLCAYDFKPNTWKRHTSWLLVKARAADTLVEGCR